MGSAEIQGALWGAKAEDWATLQEEFNAPVWRDLLKAVGAGPGFRLLDAGCGSGGASVEAAKLGCQVTGIDAAGNLLTIARKRLPAARFEQGDLETLPFAEEAFDGVIAPHSVFYAANVDQAMKELTRVTRSKGRVALSTWGKPEDCARMGELFAALVGTLPSKPPGGGPFGLSAAGALEELLEKAGLRFVGHGTSRCDFNFKDYDTFWRAQVSAGPFQGVISKVGEEKVRTAIDAVAKKMVASDGSMSLPNLFLWAVGEKA